MSIRYRLYRGEEDLPRISAMLADCDTVQPLGRFRTPEELSLWFEAPGVNARRDAIVWEDEDGTLRGYCLVEPHWEADQTLLGALRFIAHPNFRRAALDDQSLQWAEQHLIQLGAEQARHIVVRAATRHDSTDRVFALEWNGYKPVRRLMNMIRDLALPLPDHRLSEGFAVRRIDPNTEAQGWVDCYNQSFVDHWDFRPISAAFFRHTRDTNPNYRPEHDWVVCATDGTIAALCWSQFDPSKWREDARREGLLHQIGTRRGYRGRGIATALMIHALTALKAAGVATARLWVDVENPTGAKRIYERLGFMDDYPLIHYGKTIR